MQDIVYKLVPNLQESELHDWVHQAHHTNHDPLLDEITREREFYKARNLPCPKDVPQENKETEDMETKLNEAHQESDYHRMDEQVNLCLECSTNSNLKNLKRRFIRCSSQATITQLKKFVAKKVLNGIEKYREVRLLICCAISRGAFWYYVTYCEPQHLMRNNFTNFFVSNWHHRSPDHPLAP